MLDADRAFLLNLVAKTDNDYNDAHDGYDNYTVKDNVLTVRFEDAEDGIEMKARWRLVPID
jgi:hypothetical protein